MIFTGYNPYAPPRTTPPHAGDLPEVPLHVFAAAEDVHATHLSADGRFAYCERYGAVLQAEWDGGIFGAWWLYPNGLPPDAVRM